MEYDPKSIWAKGIDEKADDEYRTNRPVETPMSANLVQTATFLSEMERKIDASGVIEPIVATETPEAAARLDAAATANMEPSSASRSRCTCAT